MSRTRVEARFALCIDNRRYRASLIVHKLYRLVPDLKAERHGLIRIIDETGEDYLYSRDRFVKLNIPASLRQRLAAASG
jgi:hypothetical protein